MAWGPGSLFKNAGDGHPAQTLASLFRNNLPPFSSVTGYHPHL